MNLQLLLLSPLCYSACMGWSQLRLLEGRRVQARAQSTPTTGGELLCHAVSLVRGEVPAEDVASCVEENQIDGEHWDTCTVLESYVKPICKKWRVTVCVNTLSTGIPGNNESSHNAELLNHMWLAYGVIFSRLLYVAQACNLLITSVKMTVSLPINLLCFLWTAKHQNPQHMKWSTRNCRHSLVAMKQGVCCVLVMHLF